MLRIVHCSSEVVPFSKTGGLADVSSALPQALTRLGHDVTVLTPLYGAIDRERHGIGQVPVRVETTLGGRSEAFEVFETSLPAGTRVVFMANQGFFGRKELYGHGIVDHPDNHLRFSHFCAAVFKTLRALDCRPDVIHCHDWQTGLVPAYNAVHHLRAHATVFTIHNLAYQGLFPAAVMPDVGMPWDLFNPEGIEFWGKVNFLKAGMVFSDRITTVSPRYAAETMTQEFGCGLDGMLRKRAADVIGILNGADYTEWSPENDRFIPARYSRDDLAGKRSCRADLLAKMGISDTGGPVFGAIGRVAAQKGFDLLAEAVPALVSQGGMLVVLGTGEKEVEDRLLALAADNPGRVGVRIAYDNALAHQIEAGADFFVMPSRYEPCGLNQIYSLRYGTIPVVHAVGGLEDSVIDIDEDPGNGTGIKLRRLDLAALTAALARADALWHDARMLAEVRRRAMGADFSWERSAERYVEVYRGALARKGT